MASDLHRTATTTYLCCVPTLEESAGAGRVGLAGANIQSFYIFTSRIARIKNHCIFTVLNIYNMLNGKLFAIILLGIIAWGCKDDENELKKLFSIENPTLKPILKLEESIDLAVLNKENKIIDSVVYFINDIKITTVKGNEKTPFALKNQKLGNQTLTASIYFEGKFTDISTGFSIYASREPQILNYKIINTYPHDINAYTQGFEFYNGILLEGTGQYKESTLRKIDYKTGKISQQIKLDDTYFGEGITVFDGKIYQLTWEEHAVFVYDATTFKKINTLNWPYEGWGLTHNDSSLIVSTGSSNLYFVNPTDFSIQKTLGVFNEYGYQSMLNELEYVDGKIFANIYGQNDIVVIDPNTGRIMNKIDCSNLLAQAKVNYNPLTIDAGFVLNGIAYKKSTNTYFITGKCWPVIVEVKLN